MKNLPLLHSVISHRLHHRKWILPLATASLLSLILLLFSTTTSFAPIVLLPFTGCKPFFVESRLRPVTPPPASAGVALPRFAYLVSGSSRDGETLKRTLMALYHPLNRYVVHLDLAASVEERERLREFVEKHPVFSEVGNVAVIKKSNLVTYRGPTMVANTLHAAAILLREGGDWDWFINLSATDYPLVTQDDLLHVFSRLPRDLNFIDHTSNIGWKAFQRAKPIIVDPGLYLTRKKDVFWVRQKRSIPTAFRLFTGSAWVALSRSFINYCLWGWDNLPRTVLMYYANFLSSPEGYFHTVICNAQEFRNTTVNSDLHYISWDNPPKQHPHVLTLSDMPRMIRSNAPFARKFRHNDSVLDMVDAQLLFRGAGNFVPGGWCAGPTENGTDPCLVVGNSTALRPGPGAIRLQELLDFLLSAKNFGPRQCK